MPDWIVPTLTVVLVLATVMVVWTWFQALFNLRAARGDEELERYARNILFRESAVLVSISALAVMGGLSIPTTRELWMRILSRFLIILLALGLAGVSFHDWWDMKQQLEASDEER